MSLSFAAATAFGAGGAPIAAQSQESYEAAFGNFSTAPSYVLITVVDDNTGAARTGCTLANFLRGAIHREHDLPYDAAGMKKGDDLLLANREHVFHFSKREALANVSFNYSQADVDEVRGRLAAYTTEQLRDGFSGHGQLHSLYQSYSGQRHAALRDAIACVLIERGLSPGMGDRTDRLWIAPAAGAPAKLGGAWDVRVMDKKNAVIATMTVTFTGEAAESCLEGDWKRVRVTNARSTPSRDTDFPVDEPLAYSLDGEDQLRVGRMGLCDAYRILGGKLAGNQVQGDYHAMSFGSTHLGSFRATRRR